MTQTKADKRKAGKDNIVLELLSDHQLAKIQKSNDLLFSGKIAVKNEGGFKQLYDLPAPSLIDRCSAKYNCMTDVLSVRIKHYGWLCHRDSGWTKNLCILFVECGLLFIYVKPTKGYVLKLSFGLKMEMQSARKKVLLTNNYPDTCNFKFKFGFGAVEFKLTHAQAGKWREPLMNAFDDKLQPEEKVLSTAFSDDKLSSEGKVTSTAFVDDKLPSEEKILSTDIVDSIDRMTAKSHSKIVECQQQAVIVDSIELVCQRTPPSINIPCHIVDSIDLMTAKSHPKVVELQQAVIVDSIELVCQRSPSVSLPCHIVDSIDLLTHNPHPKTVELPKAVIVDSIELMNQRLQLSPPRRAEYMQSPLPLENQITPKTNKLGTVAEKIEFFKNLAHRPQNSNTVKHSITMRNPYMP